MQIKFCKESTYENKCILITKTQQNQGVMYTPTEPFSANPDMIIINIKPEFEPYYDDIYNSLQNDFNYKELIENNTVQVKTKNDIIQYLNNIGIAHVKNFTVTLNINDITLNPQILKTMKKKNIELV